MTDACTRMDMQAACSESSAEEQRQRDELLLPGDLRPALHGIRGAQREAMYEAQCVAEAQKLASGQDLGLRVMPT